MLGAARNDVGATVQGRARCDAAQEFRGGERNSDWTELRNSALKNYAEEERAVLACACTAYTRAISREVRGRSSRALSRNIRQLLFYPAGALQMYRTACVAERPLGSCDLLHSRCMQPARLSWSRLGCLELRAISSLDCASAQRVENAGVI